MNLVRLVSTLWNGSGVICARYGVYLAIDHYPDCNWILKVVVVGVLGADFNIILVLFIYNGDKNGTGGGEGRWIGVDLSGRQCWLMYRFFCFCTPFVCKYSQEHHVLPHIEYPSRPKGY